MTYQRNIQISCGSQEPCDELAEDEVPEREVGAGEEAEDDDHAGRLGDLVAVRPLHPPQLGPHLDQEVDDAPALARLRACAPASGSRRRSGFLRLGAALPRARRGSVRAGGSVRAAPRQPGLSAATCSSSSSAASSASAWSITACSAGFVGCSFAAADRRVAFSCCSRRFALRFCRGPRHRQPRPRPSAFPCAGCGGRTSGSICASRYGPDRSGGSCPSGSCGACIPRKRALPRFVLLREPFLRIQAIGGAEPVEMQKRAPRPARVAERIAPAAGAHEVRPEKTAGALRAPAKSSRVGAACVRGRRCPGA